MSIKTMVTKLALAFAAKKGMEAFRNVGGIDGLQSAMANKSNTTTAQTGSGTTSAPQSNGLDGILSSLGLGGSNTSGQSNLMQGSLGQLFGTLAGAFGGQAASRASNDSLDTQFDANDIKTDEEARAVMRAMVHMTRADGAIDAQEQSALFNILDEASPEDRATLQEAMREPVDAKSIAAETPQHVRKEVYASALMLGAPNSPQERSFLQELAEALGLHQDETNNLHEAMGKSKLDFA